MKLPLLLAALLLPVPAAAQSATPSAPGAAAAYTFDILDAQRQVIGTYDLNGRLTVRGDLSAGAFLRVARPGVSRLFPLAAPVTDRTALGDVTVQNGGAPVTLAALLQVDRPAPGTAAPSPTSQQMNSLLGLSTSIGTVNIGMSTSIGLNGGVLVLPLFFPPF
ncbi:hypothetical protein [Deinococcus maricopensis]|uniref:Uncharacterized protein n=1 Tax=Deinococcus maricopensis (strain DSM 21211 / LMG 22137 / NRRL B-23946 / LB-34) TaxID=709986 RepID=E8U5T8_DEIML|nr:hypothetical protein [Deinococcus maricopensis]ADV66427.1 hypothetical protein Deima_0771 [Deinococcus maricopensis DSM 21211]